MASSCRAVHGAMWGRAHQAMHVANVPCAYKALWWGCSCSPVRGSCAWGKCSQDVLHALFRMHRVAPLTNELLCKPSSTLALLWPNLLRPGSLTSSCRHNVAQCCSQHAFQQNSRSQRSQSEPLHGNQATSVTSASIAGQAGGQAAAAEGTARQEDCYQDCAAAALHRWETRPGIDGAAHSSPRPCTCTIGTRGSACACGWRWSSGGCCSCSGGDDYARGSAGAHLQGEVE